MGTGWLSECLVSLVWSMSTAVWLCAHVSIIHVNSVRDAKGTFKSFYILINKKSLCVSILMLLFLTVRGEIKTFSLRLNSCQCFGALSLYRHTHTYTYIN